MSRYRSTLYIVAAVVLILVIGLLGFLPLSIRWVLIMLISFALLGLAGRDITGSEVEVRLRSGRTEKRFVPGRVDGVLIDSRNKISLSRLQLILWTVVVLSAWAAFALHRVIPVLEGRLPGASTSLVSTVAGLLGGDEEDEATTARAVAVLEQIMGAEQAAEIGAAESAVPYSPLDIAFPQEVLLALGISIASLAGAGLIKTNQATNDDGRALEVAATRTVKAARRADDMTNQLESLQVDRNDMLESLSGGGLESADGGPAPTQAEMDAAQARLTQLETELQAAKTAADSATRRATELMNAQAMAVGELHSYTTPAEARWSDMLRGDTVANFQYTDLGKVQMFFFTIILIFTYAALIWSIMSMPLAPQLLQMAPSMSLPQFSDSFVVTMALSHGGYLATKAAV